jgi:hypothetical protein
MQSPWRAGGESGTFALRYAALWGWVDHVLLHPDSTVESPLDVLVDAAGHSSDGLAAPALLAIGINAG